MYLTIMSMFWVCYDHSIRGNVKFITNFGLSLGHRLIEILWTGFSMCSKGPAAAESLQFMVRCCGTKHIKWPNVQTIPYTVILSWISNHVHVEMWIEITDPFSNPTGLAAQGNVQMDK